MATIMAEKMVATAVSLLLCKLIIVIVHHALSLQVGSVTACVSVQNVV